MAESGPVLALDIGNGSIKYGLFCDGRREGVGRLALVADLAALAELTRDRAVAAVSVNPPVLARVRTAFGHVGAVAREIGPDIPYPIAVHYRPPEDCGPDRIMAAVGALHLCPKAEGVLVFDAGTCLTATVAVRDGGILGGAILPGPELMARSLADGTARLPSVSLVDSGGPGAGDDLAGSAIAPGGARADKLGSGFVGAPGSGIGDNTVDAIRAGIGAAIAGAVRELVARCRDEAPVPLTVVAVGTGSASLALQVADVEFVHPFGTLRGVYESLGL